MNKFINVLLAAGFVMSLGSCLKDKKYNDGLIGNDIDGAGVPKVIELGIINNAAHNRSVAVDFKDAIVEVPFLTVRLAAREVASEDITVTIDTSFTAALLLGYDTTNKKTTARLPTSLFSYVGSLKVVILKGTRETVLKIKTNAFNYDPSTTYGLGFKIGSVDKPGYIISENFGTYVTTIGAKNKYDGEYSLDGYHNRPTFTFPYADVPMNMVTTGASSVAFFWIDADDFGHPIGVGPGQISWYGNTIAPEITFDPVSNNVASVKNNGGATVITLFTGPGSFPSRFDPATKTIYVCWNYNNNPLRAFFDTLTYVKPRP